MMRMVYKNIRHPEERFSLLKHINKDLKEYFEIDLASQLKLQYGHNDEYSTDPYTRDYEYHPEEGVFVIPSDHQRSIDLDCCKRLMADALASMPVLDTLPSDSAV